MTIFFRSRFFFNNFSQKKHFKVRFVKIDLTSVKQDQNLFLSAATGAVAIARYYFYSGTTAVAPLLNLTKSGSGL